MGQCDWPTQECAGWDSVTGQLKSAGWDSVTDQLKSVQGGTVCVFVCSLQ